MKSTHSAALVLLQIVIALLQGGVMAWLTQSNAWLQHHPEFAVALFSVLLLGPGSFYLLLPCPGRIRLWMCALLLLALSLGAWRGSLIVHEAQLQAFGYFDPRLDYFYFTLLVLWQILLPAAQTLSNGQRLSCYAPLFHLAWHNILTLLEALAFTVMFWALLLIGSALFQIIGFPWPQTIVQHDAFSYPALMAGFACAVLLSQHQPGFTAAVQQHVLEILKWLLPLTMLISLCFVLLLPYSGVTHLLKSGYAAALMLWLLAWEILFINAAYADGSAQPGYPRWLLALLRLAPLPLPVLSALSVYALWLRIAQYGLSVNRVWGLFVAGWACAYALAYVVCIASRQAWLGWLGRVNIVLAGLMACGIILLLSPLLNPQQLVVSTQLARLYDGRTDARHFDYRYLTSLGQPGLNALNRLAAAQDLPQADEVRRRASQVLRQPDPPH
jgi:hypothetical protein